MVQLKFYEALNNPFKEFALPFSFTLSQDSSAFSPHQVTGDASGKLTYYCDDSSKLFLKGHIKVPFKFVCDRCAGTFEKNLFLNIDEVIYPKSENEDEELTYDRPIVMLDNLLESLIITGFPTKVLCKENCKGLCKICGANLNEADCKHNI